MCHTLFTSLAQNHPTIGPGQRVHFLTVSCLFGVYRFQNLIIDVFLSLSAMAMRQANIGFVRAFFIRAFLWDVCRSLHFVCLCALRVNNRQKWNDSNSISNPHRNYSRTLSPTTPLRFECVIRNDCTRYTAIKSGIDRRKYRGERFSVVFSPNDILAYENWQCT